MSYEPTNWKSGDVVTSTKLNKMEQGIANAGALVCTADQNGVLDHTWQEIHDAAPLVWCGQDDEYYLFVSAYEDEGDYVAVFIELTPTGNFGHVFIASSADGYPVHQQG